MDFANEPERKAPAARDEGLLGALREQVARLGPSRQKGDVLPFGVTAIDKHLPGGGLSRAGLHEVSGGAGDITYGASAALFIAGILARLEGPVLWCLRHHDLFAPGLAGVGLHPDRVIYVEAYNARTVLLVMEEALKHGGLAGVVGETDRVGLTPSRRLQLAAETASVPAFLLRRWRRVDTHDKADATAAVTRWRVSAVPNPELPSAGMSRALWFLELLRCRNAEASSWTVEACDAYGTLAPGDRAVPAHLADRPRTPARRSSAAWPAPRHGHA